MEGALCAFDLADVIREDRKTIIKALREEPGGKAAKAALLRFAHKLGGAS